MRNRLSLRVNEVRDFPDARFSRLIRLRRYSEINEVAGSASRSTQGWLTTTSEERPGVRRDADEGGHCEQYIGDSINQHNAENGHREEGTAQA